MNDQQQRGRIVAEVQRGVLKTTLWSNPTQSGEMLSVTLRRGYQRKPGDEWSETKMSLPVDKLLTAAEMLREMHAHAWEHRAAEAESHMNISEES